MHYIYMLKGIVLLVIGIYLFVRHRNSRIAFWFSVLLSVVGAGEFRYILTDVLLFDLNTFGYHALLWTASLLHWLANTSIYYLVLIFYLAYTGYLKTYMIVLLFLPLGLSLYEAANLSPLYAMNYQRLALWGSVYWTASVVLFLIILFRESNLARSFRHAGIACICFLPETLLVMTHFQNKSVDQFSGMLPVYGFTVISLFALIYIKNAFVGIYRSQVLKNIAPGTTILHHAMKNCAGKIKLSAWNIRQSLDTQNLDEIRESVNDLEAAYDHMTAIASKIAVVAGGVKNVIKQPYDLSVLLDRAISKVKGKPGIEIVKQYQPVTISLDPVLIEECVLNILNNAVEAISGKGTITISLRQRGKRTYLSVEDTGKGMNPEQLSNIFEPFFTTKTEAGSNFGIGMYYVKKVMDVHKGKVRIQSKPGQGTTHTLIFKGK